MPIRVRVRPLAGGIPSIHVSKIQGRRLQQRFERRTELIVFENFRLELTYLHLRDHPEQEDQSGPRAQTYAARKVKEAKLMEAIARKKGSRGGENGGRS